MAKLEVEQMKEKKQAGVSPSATWQKREKMEWISLEDICTVLQNI